jgi:type IV secretion system protein VirB2
MPDTVHLSTFVCTVARGAAHIRAFWSIQSSTRKRDPWRYCQTLFISTVAVALVLYSDASHAQGFGRINTALQTLVNFMTGTTGRLLGILGVAGLGIAAWFGRLSYWRAGEIVLGIAIVFGASEIVDLFAR